VSGEQLLSEHKKWDELHGRPRETWQPHTNAVDPSRRLRVAYVSGDFRGHAVSSFIEPILRCHDKQSFEVICYANNVLKDDVTERLRSYADHWRWSSGMDDDKMEESIRADQIDILVELAGHSAGNRLRVVARKPAPVQITYIGYPATTGIAAIDYRFTDAVLNPPDEPSYHVEELYRLACGSACYVPRLNCPDAGELPALRRGYLTFGGPHNLGKLHSAVFDLWARLLHEIPTARLVLFRESIRGQGAKRLSDEFAQRNVSLDRIDLHTDSVATRGYAGYMSKYNDVDICLDTFPANAGTTCCEALWMGVPWLTTYGDRFFGRMTASILTRLDMADWILESGDEIIEKAKYWSAHFMELADLRKSLRTRMASGTLGDPQLYTKGLEEAYRDVWRRWCDRRSGKISANS
jgi:predicted O-linked N-acetylglucosamine transferase (SPINDLY family)